MKRIVTRTVLDRLLFYAKSPRSKQWRGKISANRKGKPRVVSVRFRSKPCEPSCGCGRHVRSLLTRQKLSVAGRGNPKLIESGLRCKNAWYHYEYLDRFGHVHDFKSSWELHFAQWLDSEELTWRYEPVLFLSSGQKWKVDFWVEEYESYYEIKASIYDHSKYEQALMDGVLVVLISEDPALTFGRHQNA